MSVIQTRDQLKSLPFKLCVCVLCVDKSRNQKKFSFPPSIVHPRVFVFISIEPKKKKKKTGFSQRALEFSKDTHPRFKQFLSRHRPVTAVFAVSVYFVLHAKHSHRPRYTYYNTT